MRYYPDNFSSEFKENTDLETTTTNPGVNLEIIPPASLFIDKPETLIIKYASIEETVDNFKLEIVPNNPNDIKFLSAKLDDGQTEINLPEATPWTWGIGNLTKQEKTLKINFVAKAKSSNSENFKIKLSYQNKTLVKADEFTSPEQTITAPATIDQTNNSSGLNQNQEYYLFYTQDFTAEIVQNDLNLTTLVNGQNNEQGANFGDKLNYTITYHNQGKTAMKNIVIMTVLEGPVDWGSLKTNGQQAQNTITWTPEELPALKEIAPDAKGKINFQIKIKTAKEAGKVKPEIKAYTQFNTFTKDEAGKETITKPDNNLSNTILVKINSDLALKEKLLYYTEDNIPVGTGPLPPKLGEETTLKVYWQINNSLHDLKNIQVINDLPKNVKWNNKDLVNTGKLKYDQFAHRVIWDIDELSTYDKTPTAEFSISITPNKDDINKILILLNQTRILALDTVTNQEINNKIKARTTKLEDDKMIKNDGVVQK